MGLGGQGNKPSAILLEKNPCALYRKLGESHGSNMQLQRRENFSPNGIHSPDVLTCRNDWENKRKFRYLWMETNGRHKGHNTSISVQRWNEQQNAWTGHFRHYASLSGNPTHRTEIQTAKCITSLDVCLTVISFSPPAYNTK